MGKKEVSTARQYLGRTQRQMAHLLGVSLKAIQSFEQGWRNIPVHIERQVLFLLASKKSPPKKERPYWVIRKCLKEIRQNWSSMGISGGKSLLVYSWDDLPGPPARELAKEDENMPTM